MCRTVLAKTDRVVSRNPDHSDLRKGGKTDCTSCIRNEVQESSSVGNDSTVCRKTVHNSTHAVFTNTIPNITSAPVSEPSGRRLEINCVLPSCKIGASQICRTSNKFWNCLMNL